MGELFFDLNIEKVLEHWPVAFAVREVLANALDEQVITGTAEPVVSKDPDGVWHVIDFGRGLRYEHLTQKENAEKRRHREVIGQFGMGLKDALAVFDRRGIAVEMRSRHADVSTRMRPKEQFGDVVTLHAVVRPPSDPDRIGTDVALRGVADTDIDAAKQYFLRYSGERVLETTRYGQVLARATAKQPARIYVKGLKVAEEPNFLFSYNVTDVNKPLRAALNRERSNVGRSAYTPRVQSILKECGSAEVAGPLAADLENYVTGRMHDELAWRDIAVHACRILATHEQVLFVTPRDLERGSPQLQYAKDEGYRLITVPEDIVSKLRKLTDLDGRPMVDLAGFREAWNDSFSFRFVDPDTLTDGERAVYALTDPVARIAGIDPDAFGVHEILISETMRLNEIGHPVVGIWERVNHRIVIRRDQLDDPATYCGTLLHELTHAISATIDGSLEFENALTGVLGVVAAQAVHPNRPSWVMPDA